MRKIDCEALQRALRMAKARDRQWPKRRDEPWEEAALAAAYGCQVDALNLRPWQPAPMDMSDDRPRDPFPAAGKVAAWELRRRLIRAGLSVFEPDPPAALAAVVARQRGERQASGKGEKEEKGLDGP